MLDKWDLVPLTVSLIHILLCPYTKVEESFGMQAVHDIITYRYDLEVMITQKYDHFQFPGVVPRTFIAALGLGYLSFPFYWLCLQLGFSKVCGIYIVRGALALLNISAFAFLRRAVSKVFGEDTGVGLYLVICCQFHLPFYLSRTLPNTYAMCVCTLAFAYWLLEKQQMALALVTFAGVCFRCDLVLLAIPMGVWLLVFKAREWKKTVLYPLLGLGIGVCLSLSIDSYFWRRLVWPELEVLLFNTVENRSSEWGVSPWHWYWTSALPRMLMGEVVLVLCGLFLRPVGRKVIDQRVASVSLLVLSYVGLYSFLPHKELRFLFPVLPGFAVLAALGLIKL